MHKACFTRQQTRQTAAETSCPSKDDAVSFSYHREQDSKEKIGRNSTHPTTLLLPLCTSSVPHRVHHRSPALESLAVLFFSFAEKNQHLWLADTNTPLLGSIMDGFLGEMTQRCYRRGKEAFPAPKMYQNTPLNYK